ncbi:MAG: hypothetical protein ACI4J5_01725 [Oscillospiraceae bacterium]
MMPDSIKKYVISTVLLTAAAAGVQMLLNKHMPTPSYKADDYSYSEYYTVKKPAPTSVSGITEEEFRQTYPAYEIGHIIEEYSAGVPEGYITRVQTDVTAQSHNAVDLYISCGISDEYREHPMENLVDTEEYFRDCEDEKLVSHNEFYLADGRICTVDILSDSAVDKNGAILYRGQKYLHVTKGDDPTRTSFAAFNTVTDSSPAITYDKRFALKAGDYNGDGNPDICLRADSPEEDGAYYYMHFPFAYKNKRVRHHSGVDGKYDDGFFVYGETDESIVLDRIDRNAYYFLSKDESGDIIPAVYSNDGDMLDSEKYINNGLIFSSRYENGQIMLKAGNISPESCTYTPALTLKCLDGKVWRDTDIILPECVFSAEGYKKAEVSVPQSLEAGIYRIELCINDTFTMTEFFVY